MSVALPAAVILVHEREPYWTPELQRRFVNEPVTIRRCDPLTDAEWRRLPGSRTVTVVVLERTQTSGLQWLLTRNAMIADPVIVLATPGLAEWEWTLRGLGVISFHVGPIAARELARQCRRLLAANTEAVA